MRQSFHCRLLHLSHLHSEVVLPECAPPMYPVFASSHDGYPRQAGACQEPVKSDWTGVEDLHGLLFWVRYEFSPCGPEGQFYHCFSHHMLGRHCALLPYVLLTCWAP